MNVFVSVVLMALGFLLLMKGADFFVDGASALARRVGIPQLVIGLTIVAMGTSAPEAAVSISAALKGNGDITIGNIVGSNILNILIILGITSLFATLQVARSTIRYELPFLIGITLLLLVLGYSGYEVSRLEGVVLLACFLGYMVYLVRMAKEGNSTEQAKSAGGMERTERMESNREPEPAKKKEATLSKVWVILLLLAAGITMIILGSNLVVNGAAAIATAIGISDRFISLTIVAFGTSLPELVTSVSAARKGNADIAIGNIVGSNIFNILFIIGISALITPVTFQAGFVIDTIVACAVAVLLLLGVIKSGELRKSLGILMLACYVGYFVYLL